MRLLIMGDSWGCGEWYKEFTISKECPSKHHHKSHRTDEWFTSGVTPNTDIGKYLKTYNHHCINIAVGGDANLKQLANLKTYLNNNSNYDMIIWFHTEPVRDYVEHFKHLTNDFSEFNSYEQVMAKWFEITYSKYQELYNQYQIPFFVIGGMSPLHPVINNYTFAKYKLVDWANELIFDKFIPHGYNVGNFPSFSTIFPNFNDEKLVKESQETLNWIQYCYSHTNFPDWGHPDRRAHEKLAEYINTHL
jgi:hypothetical protein